MPTCNFGLEALDLRVGVMDDFVHSRTEVTVSFGQVFGDMLLIGAVSRSTERDNVIYVSLLTSLVWSGMSRKRELFQHTR
jgi:hypothetical protein